MIDQQLRAVKERTLAPVAAVLARGVPALTLTLAGLGFTLAAAGAAAASWPAVALACWLAGRLLDGLDGEVARLRGEACDLGGYLDIVVDTVGYAVVPVGVAVGVDTPATWVAVAVLLATFYVNAVSWTYLSAVLEKRGAGSGTTGERTTVTMPASLVEGAETVVLFAAFLALPQWAAKIFAVMAGLVVVTVVHRLVWASRHLRVVGPG